MDERPESEAREAADEAVAPKKFTLAALARPARLLAMALAGLLLGLLAAEAAFARRDQGAFPHLHGYRPDARLGVRLRPGEQQRYGQPGAARTEVRINRQGYRGDDFPEPGGREVLLIGDSQAFGLGVEQRESVAARLSERLGGLSVLNASVPSYGPHEYLEVTRDLLGERSPKAVVVLLDLVTDTLELNSAAVDRVTAAGGWLIDQGSAGLVRRFPGDEALRGSHLLHAVRRLGAPPPRRDEPSIEQQSLRLLTSWTRDAYARLATEPAPGDIWDERLKDAGDKVIAAHKAAEALIVAEPLFEPLLRRERQEQTTEEARYTIQLRACTCDCFVRTPQDPLTDFMHTLPSKSVRDGGGPGGLGLWGGLYGRRRASNEKFSLLSDKVEKGVRKMAAEQIAKSDSPEKVRPLQAIVDALDRRDELRKNLRALDEAAPRNPPEKRTIASSPFEPFFAHLAALARSKDARLVVVVLPLPTQVRSAPAVRSPPPQFAPDITETQLAELALADALYAARLLGARAVDAREALLRAGGEVYLEDDHLNARGHDALSAAIAEELQGAP